MSSNVPRIFRFTQRCTLRGPRYAVDKILHCSYYLRSIYLKTLFKWMILSPFRWCCYCPPLIQLHFVADCDGGWSFDVHSADIKPKSIPNMLKVFNKAQQDAYINKTLFNDISESNLLPLLLCSLCYGHQAIAAHKFEFTLTSNIGNEGNHRRPNQ